MIGLIASTLRRAGALGVGLLLFGAVAAGQERSISPLDQLLAREAATEGELGPTGRRLWCDELEAELGAHGRFGFGLEVLGWRAPIALAVLDEEGREVPFERVGGARYPSHATETWRGDGLELSERKYVTEDDCLVVELELREGSGAQVRELGLRLSGDATPWRERSRSRFEVLSVGEVGGEHLHDLPALPFGSGRLEHDGVVFPLVAAEGGGARGAGASTAGVAARIALSDPRPKLATWHFLLADGGEVALELGGGGREVLEPPDRDSAVLGRAAWRRFRALGSDVALWHLAWEPPPGRAAAAIEPGGGARLLSAVLETPPIDGRLPVLLGEVPTPSGVAQVVLAGTDCAVETGEGGERFLARYDSLPAGGTLTFRAALQTGPRLLPALAAALDSTVDAERFARHVVRYHDWFERQVPRFSCSEPRLEVAWADVWYRLRRRLLELGEQGYTLPIFREEGASHVELESLPYVLSAARWLKDVEYVQGPVRAFMIRQREDGTLPLQLPPTTEWSRQTVLARCIVDAFEVNGSESFLRENLPLLRDAVVTLLEGPKEAARYLYPGLELLHVVRGLRLLGDEPDAVALEGRWHSSIEQGASLELRWDQELLDGGAVISAWIDPSGSKEHPSILADQWIRVVGGLEPRDDGRIELRPRLHALEHFAFEGLHYRGHLLDLYWDRPDGTVVRDGIPEGYTLREGDDVLFHAEALEGVLLD